MPASTATEEVVMTIAHIAYNVNRAYAITLNDHSLPLWKDATDQVKAGYRLGVMAKLESNLTPEQQHQLWCKSKLDAGWTYGKHKDTDLKYHPNLVTYAELPEKEKVKDVLFQAVVDSFKDQS